MVKNHLKRIAAPKTWHIRRKKNKFVTRPKPGAHELSHAMSLSTFLRDIVKVAKTSREVKHILNHSQVLVDGKRRRDPRFNIGLMDVLSLPDSNQYFRVTLDNKGRLTAAPIDKKESSQKLSQVRSIRMVKGGKLQLGLADGRVIGIKKQEYARGDVVLLSLPDQKIVKHFVYDKNKPILLVGGKHAGKKAKITTVEGSSITFETEDKENFDTRRQYAFITGDTKPELTI